MNQPAILSQLCTESPAFASVYQESLAHAATMAQAVPRVVVCGLLKAGKSTLLNALTNQLEREYFTTHATRATVAVNQLEYEQIAYVDTPGLDANAADDQEAWRGLVSADQLLFVHNMRIGTLDQQELGFLRQLQQHHPALLPHLIVVLTHAESAQDEWQARLASYQAALADLFPTCPPMLTCSWPRYFKGMRENKPALLALSGIPELRQRLGQQLAQQAQTRMAQRLVRQKQYQQQMQALIQQAIAQRLGAISALEQARCVRERSLYQDFAAIVRALKMSMSHYTSL